MEAAWTRVTFASYHKIARRHKPVEHKLNVYHSENLAVSMLYISSNFTVHPINEYNDSKTFC